MLVKLRTTKYTKAKTTNSKASVEFVGRVQRMARVHHYGLRDRPARGAKGVPYDECPLLGLVNNFIDDIHKIATTFLM